MIAKEYLQQIRIIDIKIKQRQREYEDLCKKRFCIGSFDYSSDRIQKSSDGQGYTKIINKIVDLKIEINKEIDRFYDLKHKIIGEIQQLEKPEQIEILYRRYVLYQNFAQIAVDMGYNYNWCCHIHGEALKSFTEKILEKKEVRN